MSMIINSSASALLPEPEVPTDATEAWCEALEITPEEAVAILIEDFGGIEEVRKDTYGRLHATCVSAGDYASACALLDEAESIFINNNFSEADRLKETTKSGKIKRTKFLPNDYLSAKSVLLGCLEKGIPLFDEDGNPIGKSALSDKRLGKSEKTPEMKLKETLLRALKIAREIHGTSIVEVRVIDDMGNTVDYTVA